MIVKKSLFLLLAVVCFSCKEKSGVLVFQSDFGVKDGAVAAMKGVANSVSTDLQIYDITHEITAFNISEAAYRLNQSASYWPSGTVFVSIIDPGVGSTRKSIVMKTKTGHFFVTPDNGTLTLIAESMGIEAVREIDETRNRLQGSGKSYTFHGRDVYAYTGARLASHAISFEEVGPLLNGDIVRLPGLHPIIDGGVIKGSVPVLDIQYGNVWTNIDEGSLSKVGISEGDSIQFSIAFKNEEVYAGNVKLLHTFSDVAVGQELAYMNSLLNLSFAINQGNFAELHKIDSGEGWVVTISKP